MIDRRLLLRARAAPAALLTTIALAVMAGFIAIAQAWVVSSVIDCAFLGGQPLAILALPLLGLLGIIGLRALAAAGGEAAAGQLAAQVKRDLRAALVDHLMALGPTYVHGERTGELTTAAAEGIDSLDAYFSQFLPQLVVAVVVPLAILLTVLPIDLLSALVLLLTAPLIPFFMILIGRATEAVTRHQYALLGRLGAHFLDTLQGLTTLKLLGQSRSQADVVARASEDYAAATLRVLRVAFLSALVLEIVATLSTAIVAVEVGLRLLYGRLEFQPALFVLILASEFYIPLRLLGQRFHAAASGTAAARRIFEILSTPTAPGSGHRPGAVPPVTAVSLRDVRFTYPGGRHALRGVSLTIEAGEQIALVGPSGAGKSTIVSLLLRFIEPDSGTIYVNGSSLMMYDLTAWREQLAWVPQTPHLFPGTVAANIRLARPEATQTQIERAAEAARLHDFIRSLPRGYDTQIGERGARLSGGEAQRLALARAFLRDAPLLILDEPTSSVDPELERQLRQSTDELLRGRTALIIAHRLATLQSADRVVVLDSGRVIQAGPPSQLQRGGGAFQQMLAAYRGIPT